MELRCERVREILWPLDRPRSHVPDEEAARDHLTRCDDCRAFFLRDAEVSRLLHRLGEGMEIEPTPGLRLSVARSLAVTHRLGVAGDRGAAVIEIPVAERPPGFRGGRAELVAAAAALLLLLGGQFLASRYGVSPDTSRFTADFVRTAAVDFDRPGLDVRQIGGFYERELGRNIVPVALDEAPVTRATVCDLSGDLGSMIEYDLGGTRLVHYRIPLDASRVDSPEVGAQPATVCHQLRIAGLPLLAAGRRQRLKRKGPSGWPGPSQAVCRIRRRVGSTVPATSRRISTLPGSESWARGLRRSNS